MNFTESGIRVMLAESREACKRIRKLSKLRETVATHRLKELRHLRTLESLHPGGEVMALIDAMYTMDSGFTAHYPPRQKKLP